MDITRSPRDLVQLQDENRRQDGATGRGEGSCERGEGRLRGRTENQLLVQLRPRSFGAQVRQGISHGADNSNDARVP